MGLVEIMIALTLSLIVLAGIYTVFISSKASYRVQSGLSRLQENARFASYRLTHDVRMAGYVGCFSDPAYAKNDLNNPNSAAYPLSNFDEAVHGYDASNVPAALGISNVIANTDVITLHTTRGTGVTVTDIPSANSADFKTSPNATNPFSIGDILLITDCQGATLFQITNLSYNKGNGQGNVVHNTGTGTPGNTTKVLDHSYQDGAMLQKLATVTYYIRNDANTGRPALWVKEGSNASQELVEDVDNMQIRYGLDNNNGYITAANVTNWNKVSSVEIGLLLASPDQVTGNSKSQSYSLFGKSLGPFNDRRLRRALVFAVAIRNRLP